MEKGTIVCLTTKTTMERNLLDLHASQTDLKDTESGNFAVLHTKVYQNTADFAKQGCLDTNQ